MEYYQAEKAIYNEEAREILREKAGESYKIIKDEKGDLNHTSKDFFEYLIRNLKHTKNESGN